MVEDLFNYKEREIDGFLFMKYYGCVLKKPIKFHKTGEAIKRIDVDYNEGIMYLFLDNEYIESCPIYLRI